MKRAAQYGWIKEAGKLHSLAVMFFLAVAQAVAQENAETSAGAGATTNRRIVVSVRDRKLALLEDGRVLRVYPVAVGARVSPSPIGEFKVISRLSNPTYYHSGIVIPPGKNNPLGTRWIGLDRKGYGIHGTNEPRSIGKPASHGCIRMAKADLEQLFVQVRVGDVVEIRAQRDDETAAIFGAGTTGVIAAVAAHNNRRTLTGGQI